jgi:LemA protein
MSPLLLVIGLIVLVVVYLWSVYNGLIRSKTMIEEAWSQIDVQLKRRTDLIPNLVEAVKGYAKHEKGVFENVSAARSALMSAKSPGDMAKASDQITGALGKLFAVAEAYPELKANDSFIQLQKELSDTEDKVAYSRQYYNSTVMDYNVKIKLFPTNMIASNMGFTEKEFFGATEADKQPVKVSFN